MSAGNFKNCLAFTLTQEGGYSNNPHDPGGATMKGIIQREYDAWKKAQGLPLAPVRWISDSDVEAIYLANYWMPLKCELLPKGVDLMVFDYGVNSGISRSAKQLQLAVGAYPDGQVGSQTVAATQAKQAGGLILSLAARRLSFLEGLGNWKYFGRGWGARVNAVKAAALKML